MTDGGASETAGQGGATSFRYRAFISYAHDDKASGDWLHRALETYRIPAALIGTQGDFGPVPARLRPIFRDREELTAAADLGDELQEALAASAALIVICSPHAAASHWVNEEILAFKRLGRADRIFPLVVAGEPGSAAPGEECFPPALKFDLAADGTLSDVAAEPVAADVRESGDGRENAKLKLIAGLLGVGFDQLRQREAEAQRRRLRRILAVATAAVLVFAGLSAAAVWFALDAAQQRDAAAAAQAQAVSERDRAEKNLALGVDAARTLVWDLTSGVDSSEGVQQRVLVRIQRKAQDLLAKLTDGQDTGAAGEYQRVWSLIHSSRALMDAGASEDALTDAEAAVAGAKRLVAAEPGNADYQEALSAALLLTADLQLESSDLDGAEASLTEALKLREALAAGAPANSAYKLALSNVHARFGQLDLARGDDAGGLKEYKIARDIDLDLVKAEPQNLEFVVHLGSSQVNVGDCLFEADDFDGALETYNAALTISDGLVRRFPDNVRYLRDLSIGHERIALVKQAKDDLDGALASFEASLALTERLVDSDPGNSEYQRDLSIGNASIGDVYAAKGDYDAALKRYAYSNEIMQRLVDADPQQTDFQIDLAAGHSSAGDVKVLKGDLKGAMESYDYAARIERRAAARYPGSPLFAYWLTATLEKIGETQVKLENRDAARAAVSEALAIAERLVEETPTDGAYQRLATRLRETLAGLTQ